MILNPNGRRASRNGHRNGEVPCNLEAERAVLGCMLTDADSVAKAVQALDGEWFHDLRNRLIFETIRAMHQAGRPVDTVTLHTSLRDRGQAREAGGPAYMATLVDAVASTANLPVYIDAVQKPAAQRQAAAAAQEIGEQIRAHPENATTIIKHAAATFAALHHSITQTAGRNKLTVRKPHELLAMRFDDSDVIVGDRLAAMGQSLTILGAGGIGKSRLLLQLIAAVNARRPFLCIDTHNGPKRWLIIQTENSNRRLQHDLSMIKAWLGKDWPTFNDNVVIHTVETDRDSAVNLDYQAAGIRQMITDAAPDAIAWDPLNAFAIDDLNKDHGMRSTLMAISELSREGNPERLIVVLHHALTGKAGAVKALGFDRGSFGRNSKVLQAWTRGQINVAAMSDDDNRRLVFACGKCSNGNEFEKFAAKLNTETMIYEPDGAADIQAWQEEIGAEKGGPKATVEQAVELLTKPFAKAAWVKTIREETGCGSSYAYKLIAQAEQRRLVHRSKVEGLYARRTA